MAANSLAVSVAKQPARRSSSRDGHGRPMLVRAAQEALEDAIDEPLVAGGKFRVDEAEFFHRPRGRRALCLHVCLAWPAIR